MGDNKREAIKKAYPNSPTWAARVDKMPDNQVVAVYSRLMAKANETQKRYKNLERK